MLQSLTMREVTKDKRQMTERILNHALGIIFLLTGEEYVVVKKSSPHSSVHLLTGEVPIKCGDISVYFSMEEWDYIEGHKDIYKDVIIDGDTPSRAQSSPENQTNKPLISHHENTEPATKNKSRNDCDRPESFLDTGTGESNGNSVQEAESVEAPSSKTPAESEEQEVDGDVCTGRPLPADACLKNVEESCAETCSLDPTADDDTTVPCDVHTESPASPHSSGETVEHSTGTSHELKEETLTRSCSLAQTVENDASATYGFQDKPWTMSSSLAQAVAGTSMTSHRLHRASWTMACSSDWIEGSSAESPGFKEESQTLDCAVQGEDTTSHAFQGAPWSVPCSWDQAADPDTSMSRAYQGISRDHSADESCTFESRNCVSLPLHQSEQSVRMNDGSVQNMQIKEENERCSDNTKSDGEQEYLYRDQSLESKCSELFNSTEELLLHHGTHSDVNHYNEQMPTSSNFFAQQRLSYTCQVCGKLFSKRAYLIMHQRTHTREKPYACPQCGKSFSKRSHVVMHYRTHTGEKPYVCNMCGKSFAKRTNLVTHNRIHTLEKPFMCPVCGKYFTRRSNMVTHQRTHTGEKPYSCPDCGKCFSQRSHMVTHHKTHSGEKPYVCPVCGKGFAKRSYLDVHQRTHRTEKANVC
uniref:C2H2-type domain-containing protein n=1 Tax=Leptobrachium leishanense TaxID=445787 RepID=A0A8C5PWC4_9ANUR